MSKDTRTTLHPVLSSARGADATTDRDRRNSRKEEFRRSAQSSFSREHAALRAKKEKKKRKKEVRTKRVGEVTRKNNRTEKEASPLLLAYIYVIAYRVHFSFSLFVYIGQIGALLSLFII